MSSARTSQFDLPDAAEAPRGSRAAGVYLLAGAAVAVTGALFAAAVLLWARNGAAVFFDTMSAGIATCL